MPKFQNLEEFVEHLRSQGVRVDVVGYNGSQPTVARCGCPLCRDGAEAEPEVDEGEMQAADPGPFGDVPATIQAPGQLIDLADLANALQPGRRITIGIEAIAYDEEAGE